MVARLRKAALFSLMAVVGLNIWTGNPLLALWVGSRVQGESTQPKMGSVAVVALMIGVVGLALARALAYLGSAYDRLTGHTSTVHRHVPWLRSMRAERVEYERKRVGLSGLEIVIVAMVIIAVAAFEIWFFFYSPSPIDQRSGRG
jgi:hypothetical protein